MGGQEEEEQGEGHDMQGVEEGAVQQPLVDKVQDHRVSHHSPFVLLLLKTYENIVIARVTHQIPQYPPIDILLIPQ